ncbi:hypothetical protein EIN_146370 [Entamoeba invadens IP1]|uniref:Uncharacterized protein n=1 Tax=Entamoeba invadens IP1 TaxID=370355 RepID=L7FLU7_ENTIV|nr:hypothetical protein EIN_146370 [Entamoeba invadens IP1]ELP87633.1 hypothetical protein EIN_146370 [Entamoeba invadens IP1]|eukprot:XP_004254404.1 hypothetical protein EIN_146370 [Entamoeba invadens IP1]
MTQTPQDVELELNTKSKADSQESSQSFSSLGHEGSQQSKKSDTKEPKDIDIDADKVKEIENEANKDSKSGSDTSKEPLKGETKKTELKSIDKEDYNNEEISEEDVEPFVEVESVDSAPDDLMFAHLKQQLWKTVLVCVGPFLSTLIIGTIITGSYHPSKDAQTKFYNKIGEFDERANLLYAFFFSGILLGAIPEIIKSIARKQKPFVFCYRVLCGIIFYSFRGVIEHIWLRLMYTALKNVDDVTLRRISLVIIDQASFSLVFKIPLDALYLTYSKYSNPITFYKQFSLKTFIYDQFTTTLVANVICWIPGTAFFYTVEHLLWFPFNLLLSFFDLLIISIEIALLEKYTHNKNTQKVE